MFMMGLLEQILS